MRINSLEEYHFEKRKFEKNPENFWAEKAKRIEWLGSWSSTSTWVNCNVHLSKVIATIKLNHYALWIYYEWTVGENQRKRICERTAHCPIFPTAALRKDLGDHICRKIWRWQVIRGERPIKYGNSWFSAKFI